MAMDASTFETMIVGDERLRAFNNTVPAGILILDISDGRLLFSNRFFNEVLGVEGASILDDHWHDLFADPSDRERLMLRFVEDGEVRNFELRLKRPDGRHVWGLASLSEIPIESEDLLLFAFVDITALKEAEEEIRKLANHDALTGLPSLRLFRERLGVALARARRDKAEVAVLFIDLDGFKTVNDTMGHEAGDLVLKEMAVRFQHCLREIDTVGRIGGDEFVVLAEHASEALAYRIAQRIIGQTEAAVGLPHGEAHIGASVGIALFPRHGTSAESLLKAADGAMYRVKHATKGAIAMADG
ncbi:MAG: sensor domain-containing diguanylate cyclase [Magnetospirillum sp.]|nr:MAG: sensor domain-containing diguanylate cyclase [Magnetospirillum sp.]